METPEASAHLAIGEVLSLLQVDFPDVTISKIRFLESQGLINPERTPSGYRKFYEPDIERLRWILTQQKENFLPLKVIKAKLESGDLGDPSGASQPELFEVIGADPIAVAPPVAAAPARAAEAARPAPVAVSGSTPPKDAAAWLSSLQESPVPTRSPRAATVADPADGGMGDGLRFGIAEVAEVTGVDAEHVEALVEFGLVSARRIAGEASFDGAAVRVVRAAAPLLRRGIEPRHLRLFKNAAEREAGFYEQMILPYLKQRNPQSKVRAAETLRALTDEGAGLHDALIHAILAPHLDA